jgi:hypothetical protein
LKRKIEWLSNKAVKQKSILLLTYERQDGLLLRATNKTNPGYWHNTSTSFFKEISEFQRKR